MQFRIESDSTLLGNSNVYNGRIKSVEIVLYIIMLGGERMNHGLFLGCIV
jgi:hypothetical protein